VSFCIENNVGLAPYCKTLFCLVFEKNDEKFIRVLSVIYGVSVDKSTSNTNINHSLTEYKTIRPQLHS
jgi:hypothetical protein